MPRILKKRSYLFQLTRRSIPTISNTAAIKIMGEDPGYAITGYGIIDKAGSKFEVVDYGVIETKAGVDFPLRLLAINDKIRFIPPESARYQLSFLLQELFFVQSVPLNWCFRLKGE